MTEIALRTYNQEIKDLIDHAHFDEAIAHCQHILETFPRNIETYRLLGKAFLEQGRHGDAADVFQRVLSAIPEDWLSHVAMAIVREDESNLDMAIWHMERAYEVNPSNPTVQQEVRRLRGRRDGVEPPKLRLTRSALARMYIKGGLYGQAIAEIRSALTEDPDRPDLQILVASALYDSGSIQEASDICSAILQKLPYCLEANRVLGLILLASNKQEDADKLFQRIESLDPHIDIEVLKKEKRITEHPGDIITLSRLEYEGQEKTVRAKQASWASSLGLKIEENPQRQAIPDWLTTASQQPSAAPTVSPPAGSAAGAPSWLDEAAAAMNTSGKPAVKPAEAPPPAVVESISRTATGELPDWIQKQAMPAEAPQAEELSGPLPDWLAAATMPAQPETAAPSTGSTLPDWIKTSSLPRENPKEKISDIPDWLSAPPPPSVEALPSSSLPEYIRPQTKTSPLGVEPSNIPEWLSSSQPSGAQSGPEQEFLEHTTPTVPAGDSMPEWMKGVVGEKPPTDAALPEESIPDWLRETSAPASPPVELLPEWMRGETSRSVDSGPIQPTPQPASADEIPEWMKPEAEEPASRLSSAAVFAKRPKTGDLSPETLLRSAPPVPPATVPEVSFPDWMNPAPSEPITPPVETAGTPPEARPEDSVPDWLNAPTPIPAEAVERAPEAIPETNLPDWLNPPSSAPAPVQPIKAASQEVSSKPIELAPQPEPVPPEDIETTPEAISEAALPDWLKAVPAPAPAPTPAPVKPVEPPAEPIPMAELPDWLKGGPAQPAPAPVSAVQAPPERKLEPAPAAPLAPSAALAPITPLPARPAAEEANLPLASEPGPAQVTPTTRDGIDLPEWLVSQIQGKPKEAAATPPPVAASSSPLPDWLKPATPGTAPAPVVDWDKAASQPLPAAPVDATRPATGISSTAVEKPVTGSGLFDKSKPTGSDTVARWLDRRLKTSTLNTLDETAARAGIKPAGSPPAGRPGAGSTQLPTWLDSQKPGGSDTVVRWMDKRETGSLRKPQTASFSSISKGAVAAQEAKPTPAVETPPKTAAAAPSAPIAIEDTAAPKRAAMPSEPIPAQPAVVQPAPVFPQNEITTPSKPPEAVISRPPLEVAPPVKPASPVEDEEEGAFVPPPEWLQKALGNAVAEVPPIPKKQTGGLKPGTVTPVSSKAYVARPVPAVPATPVHVEKPPVQVPRAVRSVEEPAPAPAVQPGSWVPLAPTPTAKVETPEKPQKKVVRKKTRKLTDVESEALIREARVYLETDLQKSSEVYQKVIDDPASAEVVAGDLTSYLEQDPASPQLWNLLGDACSRAGRLQDAYRAYAEALRRM